MSIIDTIKDKLFSKTDVDEKIEEATGLDLENLDLKDLDLEGLNLDTEKVTEIKKLVEEQAGGVDIKSMASDKLAGIDFKAIAEKLGISEEIIEKVLTALGLKK